MNEKHYLHDLIASDRRHPDGQRLRPALRLARVQLRRHPDPRSGEERRHDVQGAGARSADAAQPRPRARRGARSAAAVALLGQRADLGDARQQPQLDVRPRRPALAGRVGARRRQPGVLQGRLGSSVGEGVPDGSRRPPPRGARSEDEEVHVRRDLLLDASPAVRLRRQRHAVDERRRPGRRLAEHEDVRRDRRRRRSRRAGRRWSSTPTATASATPTSSPTSRPIRPRTSASTRRSTR